MNNQLRAISAELKGCNEWWGIANAQPDKRIKSLMRSNLTSARNTLRARLKREIERVEWMIETNGRKA